MTRASFLAVLFISTAALAHGGGHLKGVVTQLTDTQLTVTADDKDKVVINLDKNSRFENDGKPSTANALPVGSRVVVHLKPGTKPQLAALVKFVAAAATRIDVAVTSDGFVVANAPTLKAGQPVTLVVTRSVEKTCATDIVLKEFGLSQPLPLNKPVEVSFTPKKAGVVRFACAMDMIAGSLKVE
ncbi:MAG: cupredoxin domain-containing protein [Myxococcus sp.]|nr:cupredoxin domain-containing protein [Myxococcus sp.]